jgi:predicted HicB family RNase H-like nuclease
MQEHKTDRVHVVVTPTQKRTFVAAAEAEGISLSSWVVRVLTLASKKTKAQ